MEKEDTTTTTLSGLHNDEVAAVSFAHVQLFVDKLEEWQVYQALETTLNEFRCCNERQKEDNLVASVDDSCSPQAQIETHQRLWRDMPSTSGEQKMVFTPHNRDIVKQLMFGFGFRVTRATTTTTTTDQRDSDACGTRSVLVTSRDPKGIQFLITAPAQRHDDNNTNNMLPSSSNGSLSIGTFSLCVSFFGCFIRAKYVNVPAKLTQTRTRSRDHTHKTSQVS
jgi:hypothetical protein